MSTVSDTSSFTDCYSSTSLEEVVEGERARSREIAAYLSAASIGDDTHQGLSSTPCISKDINLMALVQLAALRLDSDRSFLSLIDGESQYIVAEATRHQSLLPDKVTQGEPSLFLGVCKLDKSFGICPNTMGAFCQGETGPFTKAGPNVICNRTRYVVNNLRAEPTYLEKPYVSGYPYMISYLEVPLISPLGYVLGSLCVVDNRQREFNDDKIVDTMTEIAAAIMRHLVLVKTEANHARSQKLMTGLGQIVDRDSTLANSTTVSASVTANSTREASVVGSMIGNFTGSCGGSRLNSMVQNDLLTPISEPSRRESTCSQFSPITTSDSERSANEEYPFFVPPAWTPPISPFQREEKDFFDSLASSSEAAHSSGTKSAAEDNSTSAVHSTPSFSKQRGSVSLAPPNPPSPTCSTLTATSTHASPVSAEVRDTLNRAATAIRDALDMDRVTFFDAVPSGFASRSAHPTPHEDLLSTDESDSFARETPQVYCATLSESTKSSQTGPPSALPMPEAMLQRLINRYPNGHIFTADSHGPIDCRYGPAHAMLNTQMPHGRTSRVRADIRKLFSLVPNARYIVMLPLWHFQKEVWFSALFGIVENPNFAIEAADINLLTAFSHSTMVEVSRCEALAVSKAKSDFISSISHELRSPLHGIMASGELLRDSISDTQYLPLLDMIDSCSTTLLDTFDNLLDFAKINTTKRAIAKDELALNRQIRSELPLIDLSELVEETVELVQLGHSSKTGFHGEQEGIVTLMSDVISNSGASTPGESMPDASVLVTVHIEKRATWMTSIDTGAWKRIIMNLFGNALKYTRSGHIEVDLSMVQKAGPDSQSHTHICFAVKDTGIGMSPDYMKYHLYTPFAQENSLSPGTGLGLSIVQQLTKSLGGTMEVKSLIGVGTQIQVFVPLLSGGSPGPLSLHLAPLPLGVPMDIRRELVGLTLCCITVDAYRKLSGMRTATTSDVGDRMRVIKSTLKQIANDCLGMKVIFATKATAMPIADLYFFDSNICLTQGQAIKPRSKTPLPDCLSASTPMVMLCSGSGPLRSSRDEQARSKVVHLRHPLGPRKLATAFARALEIGRASQPPSTALPVLETVVEDVTYLPAPLDEKSALATVQELPSVSPLPLSPSSLSPPVPSRQISPLTSSPIFTPKSLSRQSTATELHGPPESGLHLLLVDDNPINLKILTTLAKKLNYTYATACNGLEAVHLFNASLHPTKRLFNVVFMDISMPAMNGFEATREIRKIERENGLELPTSAEPAQREDIDNTKMNGCQIVALTGLGSESSRQEAFSSGTNLFLTKPVKMSEIKQLLSEVGERVRRRSDGSMPHPTPNIALLGSSKWGLSDTSSTHTRVSFRTANSGSDEETSVRSG
ncbi:autoinducer 2 sensor kinase/phosphatase luxQ [Venturia nashicola]|nr:autoinducer 2 sensor kinase/phosphatase luxQ [Venturia nashicola]